MHLFPFSLELPTRLVISTIVQKFAWIAITTVASFWKIICNQKSVNERKVENKVEYQLLWVTFVIFTYVGLIVETRCNSYICWSPNRSSSKKINQSYGAVNIWKQSNVISLGNENLLYFRTCSASSGSVALFDICLVRILTSVQIVVICSLRKSKYEPNR